MLHVADTHGAMLPIKVCLLFARSESWRLTVCSQAGKATQVPQSTARRQSSPSASGRRRRGRACAALGSRLTMGLLRMFRARLA